MQIFFLIAAASTLTVFGAPTTVPISKYAGPVHPNSYIIKLKDTVAEDFHITKVFSGSDSKIVYEYEGVFRGYAAQLRGQDLNLVRRSNEVEYVFEDGIAALDYEIPDNVSETETIVETISGDQIPISTRTDGAGVDIYSLDTGIQINHTSFGGRARWGKTFGGYANADGNGHGTLLGDSGFGPWSDVIAGIDYVITQSSQSGRPTITTLSLSGFTYAPVDMAVTSAISKGVHFTVAAGNWGVDASGSSPAHVEAANTIGGVDSNNVRASFSNFGASIDVWALGVDVTSAWIGPLGTETRVLSGTSMSTPFVAGVLAVAIGDYGNKSPAGLSKDLKHHARPVVTGVPNGTTNLLVTQW